MKTIKMLMVFVMIVLGLFFVSMSLSGCGFLIGQGIGQIYKASLKQCPYCQSWMKKNAVVCSECGRDYPKDGKLPEGYNENIKK